MEIDHRHPEEVTTTTSRTVVKATTITTMVAVTGSVEEIVTPVGSLNPAEEAVATVEEEEAEAEVVASLGRTVMAVEGEDTRTTETVVAALSSILVPLNHSNLAATQRIPRSKRFSFTQISTR
tara:strand:- start:814 stop:1182 length:369 start_codon:yes stop_codon:yes gene_type:complete